MSLDQDDLREIARNRYGLAERVAPKRGEPIRTNARRGARPGDYAARRNVGAIKVDLPITKSGIRAGLARLRG